MLERTDWKTAPPLWRAALDGEHDLDRPALLGFSSDDFMASFQAELNKAEATRNVGSFVARPETWRPDEAPSELKLYQPAHGRFYLVTAGLVCARYGLPDRTVDAARDESVFFVLRRLEPVDPHGDVDVDVPGSYRELAWSVNGTQRWVAAGNGLVEYEERLPMFRTVYDDGGRRRRLFAGLIPVGARERYEGAVPDPPATGTVTTTDPLAGAADTRLDKLAAGIVGLQALDPLAVVTVDENSRDVLREGMFFSVLDLATFVHDQLPAVWAGAPLPTAAAPPGLGGLPVADRLGALFDASRTWRTALSEAYANRSAVLSELAAPPEPVTGMTPSEMQTAIANVGVSAGDLDQPVPDPLDPAETELFAECAALLPATATTGTESLGEPATEASFTDGAKYVVRCVYDRPHCPPSQQVQLSAASAPFRLSHFYDADAPYRDTTIPMPIDTSLEGLRKFPNAFKVAISAQLRRQMDRIQNIKLGDLDDGNIPDENPGIDLGMVCSLSIPIIAICALVLLMIMVSLLNIVFFWLPLFKICRPKVG